jgi:amino acid transporter
MTQETQRSALQPNSLGLAAVVFFVVATVAPMSGTVGALPIAFGLGTGAGTAASFAVVAAVLILFTAGYIAMSRHISSAGGFYVYIGEGLGMRAARAAGYVAFLAYNVFQVAIWGTFGFFCNILTAEMFGFELPWVLWVLGGIAVMGTLGFFHIDLSAKVLGVAVVLEVAIILLLDFAVLFKGGAAGLTLEPFSPKALVADTPAIGLMFCFLLFIGFEATAIYAEEARDPRHTIPRAAVIAVLIIAGFYMFTSWALANAYGVDQVRDVAAADPGAFVFGAAETYLGAWSVNVMLLMFVVSTFATNLGFHNAIARYQFSLARDGWAPAALTRTHPRHRSPYCASFTQTVIATALVLAFYLAGRHPYEEMFTWLIALGALGLIALMAVASVAAVAFFRRTRLETGVFSTLLAPGLAAVALAAEGVLLVDNWDFQTMDAGGLVPYLPLLLLLAAAIGFLWPVGPPPHWAAIVHRQRAAHTTTNRA